MGILNVHTVFLGCLAGTPSRWRETMTQVRSGIWPAGWLRKECQCQCSLGIWPGWFMGILYIYIYINYIYMIYDLAELLVILGMWSWSSVHLGGIISSILLDGDESGQSYHWILLEAALLFWWNQPWLRVPLPSTNLIHDQSWVRLSSLQKLGIANVELTLWETNIAIENGHL